MAKGIKGTMTVHTESSLLERATPIPDTGCWLWTGPVAGGTGYPLVFHMRKTTAVHRLMATLVHGLPPPAHDACHRCDVRSCINPNHLFWGTRSENLSDMAHKGRARPKRGHENWKAVLKPEDIPVIRRRAAAGENQHKIAAEYGVTHTAINFIHRRRSWRHIPEGT